MSIFPLFGIWSVDKAPARHPRGRPPKPTANGAGFGGRTPKPPPCPFPQGPLSPNGGPWGDKKAPAGGRGSALKR